MKRIVLAFLSILFITLYLLLPVQAQDADEPAPRDWSKWKIIRYTMGSHEAAADVLLYLKCATHPSVYSSGHWNPPFPRYRGFRVRLEEVISLSEGVTFGDIIAAFENRKDPSESETEADYTIPGTEIFDVLVKALHELSQSLNANGIKSSHRRQAIGEAYTLALTLKGVQHILTQEGQENLRAHILAPLVQMMRSDPEWFVRLHIIKPVLEHGILKGTGLEEEILKLTVREPDFRVQRKLLEYLVRSDFSYEAIEGVLTQVIREDANPEVIKLAQSVLRRVRQKHERTVARSGKSEVMAAPAAETDGEIAQTLAKDGTGTPEEATDEHEPATTRRSETRRLKQSIALPVSASSIASKIDELRERLLDQEPSPLTLYHFVILEERKLKGPNDPILKQIIRDIIFKPNADLLIRLLCLDLLWYFPDMMIALGPELLTGAGELPREMMHEIMARISTDLPQEFLPSLDNLMMFEVGGASNAERRLAIRSLPNCRDRKLAAERIEQLFLIAQTDPTQSVQAEAVKVAGMLGGRRIIPQMGAILLNSSMPREARIQAMLFLTQYPNATAARSILKTAALTDPDTHIWLSSGLFTQDSEGTRFLQRAALEHQRRWRSRPPVAVSAYTPEALAAQYTDILFDRMRRPGSDWNKDHLTVVMQRVYGVFHPQSTKAQRGEWIQAVRNSGFFAEIRALADPDPALVRPIMLRALEAGKRVIR